MTPEQLIEIAAIVLALLFGYIPVLKDWFDKLNPLWKPLVNAAVLLVVAYAMFGLACLGYLTYWTCDTAGALDVLLLWLGAIVFNQFGYAVLVKLPKSIRAYRAA